jgi:transcriptional regulator
MYQPAHGRFAVPDATALLAELAARIPATLVTLGADGLRATILPFLFDANAGAHGVLSGHVAKPNPQWRESSAEVEAIAIFNGPDAYITPAWYEEKRRTGRVVPTWNYTTVVVHGELLIHDDEAWLLAHVRQLVDAHEAARPHPWSIDDAPADYVAGQARGIVGVELRISRIDAKWKLSQNRSAEDVEGVLEGLEAGSPMERAVAAEMRRERPEG